MRSSFSSTDLTSNADGGANPKVIIYVPVTSGRTGSLVSADYYLDIIDDSSKKLIEQEYGDFWSAVTNGLATPKLTLSEIGQLNSLKSSVKSLADKLTAITKAYYDKINVAGLSDAQKQSAIADAKVGMKYALPDFDSKVLKATEQVESIVSLARARTQTSTPTTTTSPKTNTSGTSTDSSKATTGGGLVSGTSTSTSTGVSNKLKYGIIAGAVVAIGLIAFVIMRKK